ncbi:MAG TPA: hypothetical protein EYO02_04650 [Rhodospirillales bacterium]|nr:hypothetical protein [Rhodospirillales bacterium]
MVNLYLLASLEAFYKGRSFHMHDRLFDNCISEILDLPNITPNGLILPKQQTYLAYNQIHAAIVEIINSLNLEAHIKSVHAPVNIRLVNGMPDPTVDTRPRASVKMHSDMWAGEPANAIMVFLPIYGEHGKIGIKWIEPLTFPVSLMRPLDDFDEGLSLIENGIEYDAGFNPGDLLLVDPFLLHATQKNACGMRLSLEFRFIASENLISDKHAPGTRHQNYLSYPEWSDIGQRRILVSEEPLSPFLGEYGPTKNDYAAEFKIVDVDESL